MKPSFTFAIALLIASFPVAAQQGSAGASGGKATFGVAGQLAPSQSSGQQSHGCFSIQSDSGPVSTPKCGAPVTITSLQALATFAQAGSCPAAFSARHLSDGSMIRTANGHGRTHPKGLGQWLHITLHTSRGAVATLAVHGYSNKARMTETNMGGSPDAVRTVTAYLTPAPNGEAGGELWAPELTAVSSIDLISLSYDDGSSWNAKDGQRCRVTPDPLMLISGR